MSPRGVVVAVAAGDRWLLAFALATFAVLSTGWLVRTTASRARARARARARRGSKPPPSRGVRRRAGILLALGPIVGFATSPTFDEHALVIAAGATALAIIGAAAERLDDGDRVVAVAVLVAAAAVVATGIRAGPTGVGFFDAVLAFVVVALSTAAANGFGNTEGLAAIYGALGAFGVFALAGFAGQDSLAGVAVGLLGACLAFLAFNLRPASLFVGRSGRLVIGFTISAGALSVDLPIEAAGRLLVPLILLGLLLVDGVMVAVDRLRRHQSLLVPRRDHLLHRLVSRRWSNAEAVGGLLVAQLLLVLVAIFTGRGVVAVWLGVVIGAVVLAVIGTEANRYRLGQEPPRGLPRGARITAGVLVALFVVAVVPAVFAVPDVRDRMEEGRSAASRALAAARDGNAEAAELDFRRAAGAFQRAADKLHEPLLVGASAVPGLASNVNAARTLADIGSDLAEAGERVTTAIDPDALAVIDGRLPLEEVQRVTPALDEGSRALDDALERIGALDDPYLVSAVSEPLAEITKQLRQAAGEARNAAASAHLAPAIFGGDGPRTYLLVVQNNAQLRASGGAITNWGVMSAVDGDVDVGELDDPVIWNQAVLDSGNPTQESSPDYEKRFPFRPEFAMQDANRSPNFPSVARALASQAPAAGVGEVDGVLAVDPVGLAALLELTGPVRVPPWPEDITASNVVDVTLRDAYARFPEDDRNEFLGNVAETVVDAATSGSLGRPARIAKLLGAAAHEGHVILWFRRPAEQRLAERLRVAGAVDAVESDALGVYTQNSVGTKIDTYLERVVEYRVQLDPEPEGRAARVRARVELELDNTAPVTGPPLVVGPFREHPAGQNSQWVNVFTPLGLRHAEVDGVEVTPDGANESGRAVYSLTIDLPSQTKRKLEMTLSGRVRILPGGWYEINLGHQPTLEPDRVQVSVEVPPGWEIADAPRLTRSDAQRAGGVLVLDRDKRVRVRLARAPEPFDLWERLRLGT